MFTRYLVGGLCLIVVTSASVATTLHVPTEFPTIQAAVPHTGGGDTILVAPGAYAESGYIIIPDGVRLIGSGGRSRVSLSADGVLIVSNANTTVFEGFDFTATGVGGGEAVRIFDSPKAVVRGNQITGLSVLHAAGGATIVDNVLVGTDPNPNILLIELTGFPPGIESRGVLMFERNQCWLYGSFQLEIGSAYEAAKIDHNTFVGLGWTSFGVVVRSSDPTRITNNIILDTRTICVELKTVGNTDIDYNCIYWREPEPECDAFPGVSNLLLDPKLCDLGSPNGWDWRVEDDSPCVGASESGGTIGATGICTTLSAPGAGGFPQSVLQLAPNPANRWTALLWQSNSSPQAVTLFDCTGRVMARRAAYSGDVLELIDRTGRPLPAGTYFVRLETGASGQPAFVSTEKLTVVR